jgi:hypothetical protein
VAVLTRRHADSTYCSRGPHCDTIPAAASRKFLNNSTSLAATSLGRLFGSSSQLHDVLKRDRALTWTNHLLKNTKRTGYSQNDSIVVISRADRDKAPALDPVDGMYIVAVAASMRERIAIVTAGCIQQR